MSHSFMGDSHCHGDNLWMIKGFRTNWNFSSRHLDIFSLWIQPYLKWPSFGHQWTLQKKTEIRGLFCPKGRRSAATGFGSGKHTGNWPRPKEVQLIQCGPLILQQSNHWLLTQRKRLGISSVKEKEPSSCLNVCLKRPWRKTQSHQPSKSWPNASECESESETKVQSW